MTLSAPRLQGGFSFLEGPVWIAEQGHLLVSDLGPATGAQQVQPSTIHRLVPGAPAEPFVVAGSNGLAVTRWRPDTEVREIDQYGGVGRKP
ncbi:SAM-dependent methyltransferase [Paractinoplanes hotanensis]|uniref:SAM-dependent methyltransferase n=1 Tax=Paractinoplanes hotanensis TaxID=2906497 RepID=A0ABT0XWL4_9ACTN|nr:SAM-dependent methyltransferase [Actinoplanes hotanensis]MCM4078030.1 SAM-dependent methyltransferase [Actinoplanes hotanensis]